jgi:hypothetical protein
MVRRGKITESRTIYIISEVIRHQVHSNHGSKNHFVVSKLQHRVEGTVSLVTTIPGAKLPLVWLPARFHLAKFVASHEQLEKPSAASPREVAVGKQQRQEKGGSRTHWSARKMSWISPSICSSSGLMGRSVAMSGGPRLRPLSLPLGSRIEEP